MHEVNYIWEMQEINNSLVNHLQKEINISPAIAKVLSRRGVEDYDSAQTYFRPKWDSFHNGFEMKGMKKSIDRLRKAEIKGQNILIYGDYDVDGTCSVAMMMLFLQSLSCKVFSYQPDRETEGYGISLTSVEWMIDHEIDLVIALDCGIKDVNSAKAIKASKIDLIICDHHNPGNELPEAFSILNPKQIDCCYPFKELCGCGVGFKLIQCYDQQFNLNLDLSSIIQLVAIATAADIVPLINENRLITYFGLKSINKEPIPALEKIFQAEDKKQINSSDLVFKIAPRINAAGRLTNAKKAMDFLISNNEQCQILSNEIEQINRERRLVDQQMTDEALEQLSKQDLSRSVNLVFSPNWHKGVVGIVASRVIEKHYKPTIVLTGNGDTLTGSARSVSGFDIYEVLEELKHYFLRFGGHKYAAGLSLRKKDLVSFSIDFEKEVKKKIKPQMLVPKIKIDSQLSLSSLAVNKNGEVFPKIYRIIKQMEPFGPANPRPVFLFKDLSLHTIPRIVGENHIKLKFCSTDKQTLIDGIWFNSAMCFNTLKNSKSIDVVGSISENTFRGKTNLQLMVSDIRLSD
jgi:single-stranded-DNA-specific exonuclease